MTYTATYSPDDNKLRLYAATRLDKETYDRVKAAGFKWAPKQDLFVAPAWSPAREDLLVELAGEIDDEDTSLVDRAAERAERFEGYHERRTEDAEQARQAVSAIADNIPLGQPILVGHHSEKHARKDAERIENGMRKAVKLWRTAQYWEDRARGAIRHAKYKERPDVRARRIKTLEAEQRKCERGKQQGEAGIKLWNRLHEDDSLKRSDGAPSTFYDRALYIAGHTNTTPFGVYSDLKEKKITPEEAQERVLSAAAVSLAHYQRWLDHLALRLTYERAMLTDAGGTVADRTGPEKGGACKCWASPRGGWSYIVKLNRVSVSVLDNWGNGGGNFTRVIPFDKLAGVLPAVEVQRARKDGRLVETDDKTGFHLRDEPTKTPRAPAEKPDAAVFKQMVDTLRQGVQVVSAPQLFPTPPAIAQRMIELAEIEPGHRVLEPSAGTGMLLGAMGGRMFGWNPDRGGVVAVEINAALCQHLEREFPLTQVACADFLTCRADLPPAGESHAPGTRVFGSFDRVVMNPPFERATDIEHIAHALTFLRPGGKLVALCANGPRQAEQLQPLADSWEELPEGSFAEAGTGVRVALLTIAAEED